MHLLLCVIISAKYAVLLVSYYIVTFALMSHSDGGAQGCGARHRDLLRALPLMHAHGREIFFLARARGGFYLTVRD